MHVSYGAMRGRNAAVVVLTGLVATLFSALPSAASSTTPEIIFSRLTGQPPRTVLYRVPAAGGEPVQLFSSTYDVGTPSVSRDGSLVAFVWSDPAATIDAHYDHIGVYNLETGSAPTFYDAAVMADDESPVWSPDGTTIAFARTSASDSPSDIWVMRADGSAQRRIATHGVSPSFSPSGAEIAFSDDETARLVLMQSDGSSQLEMAQPAVALSPRWSPNGHRIAYYGHFNDGKTPIFTVPARGGRPTLLLLLDGGASSLAWSADSSTLYFSRENQGLGSSIYALPATGGEQTRLTQLDGDAAFDFEPTFSGPPAAADAIRPGPPRALSAEPAGAKMHLSWTEPLVADFSGVHLRQLEGTRAPGPDEGSLVYSGGLPAAQVDVIAGRTYSYSAYSVDASGNESLAAITKTVQAIQRPSQTVEALTSNGSATKAFRVSWASTEGTRFRIRYAARVLRDGRWALGPWRMWLPDTTSQTAVFGFGDKPETPREGTTYVFSVQVAEPFGNWSFPSTAKYVSVPFDDRHREIVYSAGWSSTGAPGDWLGTSHTTTKAGSTATLRTYQSGYGVVLTACATCGKLRVYFDGKLATTIDTYNPRTTQRRWLAYSPTKPVDPTGIHTLRLEAVGVPGRPRIILDAIGVLR